MKTLRYILLITFFTTSVFAEGGKGELDGKILECLHGKYGVTITHWIFDGMHVSTPLVTRELPLRIQQGNRVEYSTKVGSVHWKTSGVRSVRYTLDRKTLRLKKHYRAKELSVSECQVIALKEFEARYQMLIQHGKKN
mgnify:CR=1 FL=1